MTPRNRACCGLVLALLASACTAPPQGGALASPTPVFSVQRFFAGSTRGEGELKIVFTAPRRVVVHGQGRIGPDGALILDQTIDQPGKALRRRQWRIRQTAAGRYAGTLTDAVGPIVAETRGNALHLRFSEAGGEEYEQWLFLSPDGRRARNLMTVRKWGIVVATLDETIVKTA